MITEASLNAHFDTRTRADRRAFFAGAQLPLEVIGSPGLRRHRIRGWIGDWSLIAMSWALLVGIFVYPEAQIVGIAATAVALMFVRGK